MTVKYVIGHWTGGNHTPNGLDLTSYQLLIDSTGKRHSGLAVGCTSSTGGMNSLTYNIACCGGLSTSKITTVQFEAFCKVCAEKLKLYNLTLDKFYTHAEIGEMCNNKSITKLLIWNNYLRANIGKIDLTILPALEGSPQKTGDYLRNKINWYYKNY